MYYYREQNDIIIKEEVSFDLEQMKKLRLEIIEKCSKITHKHYETTHRPNYLDFEHIKNYKEEAIGIIEYNDFLSEPETNYLVDYYYYEHPYLVTLIERLIKGDVSNLDKILNPSDYQEQDEKSILLNERKKIIDDLSKNEEDIVEQIEALKENQKKLEKYKEELELNKNRVSVLEYYPKVVSLLKFERVAIIDKKDIINTCNFFGEDIKRYIKK